MRRRRKCLVESNSCSAFGFRFPEDISDGPYLPVIGSQESPMPILGGRDFSAVLGELLGDQVGRGSCLEISMGGGAL